MKLPTAPVANLLMISRDTVSLEMPVGNDGNSELRDLIADDEAGTPMDSVIGEDLSKSVLRASSASFACALGSARRNRTPSPRSAASSDSAESASASCKL